VESCQTLLAIDDIKCLYPPESSLAFRNYKQRSHVVRKFHFAFCEPFFRFGLDLLEQRGKLPFLSPCVRSLINRNDEAVILC